MISFTKINGQKNNKLENELSFIQRTKNYNHSKYRFLSLDNVHIKII